MILYSSSFCICTCIIVTGAIQLDSSVFGGSDVASVELTFHCVGNETKLLNCPSNESQTECNQFQQAAVLCQGSVVEYLGFNQVSYDAVVTLYLGISLV